MIVEPGSDFDKGFTGQVSHRVKQMCAGVEKETTAGKFGLLPPTANTIVVPVLPDEAADVEDAAEFAGLEEGDGRLYLWRETALEGNNQVMAGCVAGGDEALGLGGRHHHRLLQQHIQPRFQARLRLVVVVNVGREDEGGIQLVAIGRQQLIQVRFVRRWRTARFFKYLQHFGVHGGRGFAQDGEGGVWEMSQDIFDMMASHASTTDHCGTYRCSNHLAIQLLNQLCDVHLRLSKYNALVDMGMQAEDESGIEYTYTEADARWDALLASEEGQLVLDKLADEALADIRAGKVRPMVFTSDGEIAPQ